MQWDEGTRSLFVSTMYEDAIHLTSPSIRHSFFHRLRVMANPAPITYPWLCPISGVNQMSKVKSYPGYASTYPCIPASASVHLPHVKRSSPGISAEGVTPRRKFPSCFWYPSSESAT